ncbi:UNVERIFIED_CONTAM: Serine/threonine-protein phosphatase 7 long form [Sesamum radiatum]|uniref:Serine/threonine-protein phosphatase 7 long form n=1 Tax=Sesamum radiatum TaxID=300843 RepID=A0AAW2IQZ9_SESRA
MGFYGVYRCGKLTYDGHLITALVERWHPGTHTFHFRTREATIILQDIAIIWALPINGEWSDYCMEYLGFELDASDLKVLLATVRYELTIILDLPPECNPELWTSTCPLIFYAIVEMHHPERVLRHFGIRQNIPKVLDDQDMLLHRVVRKSHGGTDWYMKHIQYISRWERQFDIIVLRPPISYGMDTEFGYWDWYNSITRRLISSSADRRVQSGYQPGDASQ